MNDDDLTEADRGEHGRHTRFPPKLARRKPTPEAPAGTPASRRGRGGTRPDMSAGAPGSALEKMSDTGAGTQGETGGAVAPPIPASRDDAPTAGASIFDAYGAQWEKRHRRSARWRRVMAVARKIAWLIVAIAPLIMFSADIGTTMRCDLPSDLVDSRLRQQWLASWALSTAIVLPLALFIAVGAANVVAFGTAVILAAVWKVAVLLRDRVALPACPQGWSDAVPRHALEMPLSLVAGASFAAFLVALAVLAWQPRYASSG